MKTLGWHSLGTAFDCECGHRHELPIEKCTIGPEAATELAAFAREKGMKTCLVVADENTLAAAEDRVHGALREAGITIASTTYPAESFEATQERADDVADMGKDVDCYIAIGSGTLCDLAKAAGSKQGKPVFLYPTAASMNGYTSAIVALKVREYIARNPAGSGTVLPTADTVGSGEGFVFYNGGVTGVTWERGSKSDRF
ncbi:MAG: iron-containing alcohol dehydrogenase, partial [Candidatus Hydrogenedentes bacterium]|nr:iron-containing alcohol dehydrogenase [Candidatus Hydrogenedentota bacterium]